MSLFTAFKQHLAQQNLLQSASFAIAYSGGVDSHVLLHLCHRLQIESPQISIKALHVNHGISHHSDAWEVHCRDVCKQLKIAFESTRLKIKKSARTSLEAEARDARYKALMAMIEPDDVLLLGQHQQDQVETFLLQLKRGAGPKGLSSMAGYGEMNIVGQSLTFLRPLLLIDKAEILSYATQHKLNWQDDDSNEDTGYDRNFLRHQVLPLLNERWKGFSGAASRSARLIAEQQDLIEEAAKERLESALCDDLSLELNDVRKLSFAWQKQLIRCWINQLAKQSKSGQSLYLPSENVLEQVINHLVNAGDNANPKVVSGDWQYRRYQDRLYLVKHSVSVKDFEFIWQGEPQVKLPDGLGYLKIELKHSEAPVPLPLNKIRICFSGFGATFKPESEAMSKPLKQWFKRWKIPPWERERIPLVFMEEKLVAVGDLCVSKEFADDKNGISLIWDKKE